MASYFSATQARPVVRFVVTTRTQITMEPELRRRAQARAAALGVSFAEYVRRVVVEDLDEHQPKADISVLFNLIDEGEPTDIARDKDKMVGEAVWEEYLRDVGRPLPRQRRPAKRR